MNGRQILTLSIFVLSTGCSPASETPGNIGGGVLAAETTSSANYVGCYTDSSTRALPNELISSGATVESCLAAAQAADYAYAGVQYGGQCFAGNTLGITKVSDSSCNMPCSANSSEVCGGTWLNSIYSTASCSTASGSISHPKPGKYHTGCLQTAAGVGHSRQRRASGGNYLILLNGKPTPNNGAALEMEVTGGNLYALNSQWWEYSNATWGFGFALQVAARPADLF